MVDMTLQSLLGVVPPEGNDQWVDIEEVFAMWGFRIPRSFVTVKPNGITILLMSGSMTTHLQIAFSLTRPPRFEADPSAYLADTSGGQREGFEDVQLPWGQLRVGVPKVFDWE